MQSAAGGAIGGSVDGNEVAKFEAMAAEWWDPAGKFRPLHELNPVRLDYITRQIMSEFDRDPAARSPLEGLAALDIGCGGGLVAEPLTRLGAAVTGIDASGETVRVAATHAAQSGLAIDYQVARAEDLADAGARFDAVLALEVVEHVADPNGFVATCGRLLKPGGLFMASTLNRTARSFALAVVGAEVVLRWLPRGTHDWKRFVTPPELDAMAEAAGLEPVDAKGMVFDPVRWDWRLDPQDLSVNYIMAAVAPA
ncbi:MAG: bifunctional 2-polyprenyl-6-hydroxyphenol methylase/3-demethylubiquinol 3-O-methyltransferase UbiG [Pseudomonadota bacterium]